MTAVIRIDFDQQFPVVIGDLLLSSPAPLVWPMRLPTFEEMPSVIGAANYQPSGVIQKIAVVSKNLVLGWAGTYTDARDAITSLYGIGRVGTITPDYLDGYLGKDDVEGPGYLGFLFDGKGFYLPNYRWKGARIAGLGNVGIIGSGGRTLAELLEFFVCEAAPRTYSGTPTDGDRYIAAALFLTGVLQQAELRGAGTLQQCYGGGYEIAYFDGEQFQKLDGITYVFWQAVLASHDVMIAALPHHVISYKYTGDILTIRSLTCVHGSSGIRARHWYDHVGPIYRAVGHEERGKIDVPVFQNKWLCHYFFVQSESPLVICRVNCNSVRSSQCIRFNELADTVAISVNHDFLDSVREQILATVRSLG